MDGGSLTRARWAVMAAITICIWSAPALACPSCPTTRVVRASVFDDRFWPYLGAIALPLIVLAVICTLLYRIGASAPPGARITREREVES
jgi:hypothetical protein